MLYHAAATIPSLVFALSSFVLNAQDSRTLHAVATAGLGALQGKVLNPKGQPLAGIHIELDEVRTAMPVTSTYTQSDGSFAMYNIPGGEYEVVAESEDAEISDRVAMDSRRRALELRFPRGAPPGAEEPATVSVAQIMAPEKARKLRDRALEAFRRGQIGEAGKLAQQALQVEPEYADALTLCGLIELGNPDFSVPQETLEHALRLNPNDSMALIALAALYNRQSRFEDAFRVSERAASLAPKAWQAYLELAKASIGKNLCADALVLIRKAERLGGTRYAEVHLVKAIGLYQLKFYSDSKYEAQRAIAREPAGPSAPVAKRLLAQLNADNTVLAAEH